MQGSSPKLPLISMSVMFGAFGPCVASVDLIARCFDSLVCGIYRTSLTRQKKSVVCYVCQDHFFLVGQSADTNRRNGTNIMTFVCSFVCFLIVFVIATEDPCTIATDASCRQTYTLECSDKKGQSEYVMTMIVGDSCPDYCNIHTVRHG